MSIPLPARPKAPLPVGVSSCLMGESVRYDGAHKRSGLCHGKLDGLFTYTSICPEVGIGLSVPRPSMQLRLVNEGHVDEQVRVRGVKNQADDHTDALTNYADAQKPLVAGLGGYLFMKGSPSCGMERVKIYREHGVAPLATGQGAYAARLMQLFPQLPVEENGRMNDPGLRENFVARVFAHEHWRRVQEVGITPRLLIEFHSRYKYLLMAHSMAAYQATGRLLADLKAHPIEELASRYFVLLMDGLRRIATVKSHTNVLMHLQGYLKRDLDAASRAELAAVILAYRRAEVPLIAPITLLGYLLRQFPDDYVLSQVYLEPFPDWAGLRNHV